MLDISLVLTTDRSDQARSAFERSAVRLPVIPFAKSLVILLLVF
jgi:hypothetical protein